MPRSLASLAKALPFCCGLLFIAAAEDDCTIRILTGDDNGDGCEDTESVCNLDCELAVNDAGCSICECADPIPVQGCADDSECGAGQRCEFIEACPPCANDPSQPCDVACSFDGRCVDVGPDPCAAVDCSPDSFCAVDENGQAVCIPSNERFCTFDDECGAGSFCDFSQCGAGDANRPEQPDDSSDPVCAGVCSELPPPVGCESVLCVDGSHCVEDASGPVCLPNDSECSLDADCGEGAHCEITCQQDPNCPFCDSCLVVGQCVSDTDDCAALCGPGSTCVIDPSGSVSCEPLDGVPECTSDADCASGSCNAAEVCMSDPACTPNDNGLVACTDVCWGFCVEPQPASCLADADCAAGEVCLVRESCLPCNDQDPACLAPCFVEGTCVAAP